MCSCTLYFKGNYKKRICEVDFSWLLLYKRGMIDDDVQEV